MKIKTLSIFVFALIALGCGSLSEPAKPESGAIAATLDRFAKQNDPGNSLDITNVSNTPGGRMITVDFAHDGFTHNGSSATIPKGTGSATFFNKEGKWVLNGVNFKKPDGSFEDFDTELEVK